MNNNNNKAFTIADVASLSLNAEDQAEIVNILKSKIPSLAELDSSDFLENLSPIVRKRVEILREIQEEHDELEAKFFEERAALEAKYQALYQPLYRKRYEIVNGESEVEGVEDETADSGDEKEKGVPSFWLHALINNEQLAQEISERDEGALKYLKDIKWSKMLDPQGFKLEFFFDTNPYFSNTVLTKSYLMVDEDADEPVLEKAIGTEIQWLPGRCLTQNAAPSTETETCESFFNFFSPPEVPDANEKIDIDEAEELQTLMEKDFEIGSTIREKIIPHAVSWFTGEAMEDGSGFEDLDDNDDDEDFDEDDEEDDDEEEEETETKKKRNVPLGDGLGERSPECKQQ